MDKTLVLISSKGGSGKSTVAVGLATALSNEGKSVLLLDADEGARCLDSMLSVDANTVFDLREVLNGDVNYRDAMLKVETLSSVWVIPSPLSAEPLDLVRLGEFVKSVSSEFDYVIIDTKGQLPAERLSGLPCDFSFISVVTTDPIAVRNTGVLTSGLRKYGIIPRLIINRFKPKGFDNRTVNIDDIIDSSATQLLGIIPEDRCITGSKGPLLSGIASAAVFRIASRIDGKHCRLPEIKDII